MLDAEDELAMMMRGPLRRALLDDEALDVPLCTRCYRRAVAVDYGTSIAEAVEVMQRRSIGSVLITRARRLAGIVTERDVLRKVVGRLDDLERRSVDQIMTPDPETLRLDDSMLFVMNKMHVGGFRHVPIVDEDHIPLHVLSIKDVLAFVLEHFEPIVSNLPVEPFRGVSRL